MQWLFKTFVLRTFTCMQDLENNNWIILDPLVNIYDVYANLNVMTTHLDFNLF